MYPDDSLTLHTDLYQINMMQVYFDQGIHNKKAVFEVYFRQQPSFGSGNRGVKEYITVFRQRALETCGGWLAGVTVCSQMLFGFLTFYAGMSLAVVLSVLTIRKGLLGIAAFLCTVLPHGLVYLLVWYVLSGWSGQIQKKLHILPGLLLLIITGAGAFLEVFVSPFLWGLFP